MDAKPSQITPAKRCEHDEIHSAVAKKTRIARDCLSGWVIPASLSWPDIFAPARNDYSASEDAGITDDSIWSSCEIVQGATTNEQRTLNTLFKASQPIKTGFESTNPTLASSGKGVLKPSRASNMICFICNKTFSKVSALNRHLETLHGDPSKRPSFACESCGRVFSRKDMLLRHIATQDKSGYIDCPGCKESFRADYFKGHLSAKKNALCRKANKFPTELLPGHAYSHSETPSGQVTTLQLLSSDTASTVSSSPRTHSSFAKSTPPTSVRSGTTQEECFSVLDRDPSGVPGLDTEPSSCCGLDPNLVPQVHSSINIPENAFVPSRNYAALETDGSGQSLTKLSYVKAKVFRQLPAPQKSEVEKQLEKWEVLSTKSLHVENPHSSVQQRVRKLHQLKANVPTTRSSKQAVWECRLCDAKIAAVLGSTLRGVKTHAIQHILHPLDLAFACDLCGIAFVFKRDLRLHKKFECLDGTTHDGSFVKECDLLMTDDPTWQDAREKFIADLRVWEKFQHYDNLVDADEFANYWADRPKRPAFSASPKRLTTREAGGLRASSAGAGRVELANVTAMIRKVHIQQEDDTSNEKLPPMHEARVGVFVNAGASRRTRQDQLYWHEEGMKYDSQLRMRDVEVASTMWRKPLLKWD